MFILPSYNVDFLLPGTDRALDWQVNTDEGLELFCKVLRLNGVTDYRVTQRDPFGNRVRQTANQVRQTARFAGEDAEADR